MKFTEEEKQNLRDLFEYLLEQEGEETTQVARATSVKTLPSGLEIVEPIAVIAISESLNFYDKLQTLLPVTKVDQVVMDARQRKPSVGMN